MDNLVFAFAKTANITILIRIINNKHPYKTRNNGNDVPLGQALVQVNVAQDWGDNWTSVDQSLPQTNWQVENLWKVAHVVEKTGEGSEEHDTS